MLKSLSTLEKMHPDGTNVFKSTFNVLSRLCINYVSRKVDDLSREPDKIKSYTVLVSNINNFKLNPNKLYSKNKLREMRKRSRLCVIYFHKVSKLKIPEEHYLRLLQLYMPWRNENELKQGNQSNEDRYKEVEGNILCNIKKHEPYLDINYEEMQNFNFF